MRRCVTTRKDSAARHSGEERPPRSPKRILEILDADGPGPHWREEFGNLTDSEQNALAGFVFHISLRRKTRQRDFDGLAKLLREGDAMGLTATPAASQAAEMLERLAIFASMNRVERTA